MQLSFEKQKFVPLHRYKTFLKKYKQFSKMFFKYKLEFELLLNKKIPFTSMLYEYYSV